MWRSFSSTLVFSLHPLFKPVPSWLCLRCSSHGLIVKGKLGGWSSTCGRRRSFFTGLARRRRSGQRKNRLAGLVGFEVWLTAQKSIAVFLQSLHTHTHSLPKQFTPGLLQWSSLQAHSQEVHHCSSQFIHQAAHVAFLLHCCFPWGNWFNHFLIAYCQMFWLWMRRQPASLDFSMNHLPGLEPEIQKQARPHNSYSVWKICFGWKPSEDIFLTLLVVGAFFLGCQVMQHPDVTSVLDEILSAPADVVMTLFLNMVFCFLAFTSWLFSNSENVLLKSQDMLQCWLPPHICHDGFDLWRSDCGLAVYFPIRSDISLSH